MQPPFPLRPNIHLCAVCADPTAVQAFLGAAVSPMSEVLAGDFDLRVPIVMAVIDSYSKLSRSDVVVELVVRNRGEAVSRLNNLFIKLAVLDERTGSKSQAQYAA